ncbi:MAG: Site-specific integrase [Acidobacteriales bacterium]|nr:Site-specific integrase [Terriglobales bacterium]
MFRELPSILVSFFWVPSRPGGHLRLLRWENGDDIKVVQESLRHGNSKVTLDLYALATTTAKRLAQSKLIRMVLPETPAPGAVKGRSVPLSLVVVEWKWLKIWWPETESDANASEPMSP